MTNLSAVDKYKRTEDRCLDHLLDLDGELLVMGEGYWVEISARKVPPTPAKPHGIDYSLCLLGPDGNRLVGYDNAHPIRHARGKGRVTTNDHTHERFKTEPYEYTDAATLLDDFWRDVERVLKEEGVPS